MNDDSGLQLNSGNKRLGSELGMCLIFEVACRSASSVRFVSSCTLFQDHAQLDHSAIGIIGMLRLPLSYYIFTHYYLASIVIRGTRN